jgi:indole-3-glycerol phosphate synthase
MTHLTTNAPDILMRIAAHKRQEVAVEELRVPLSVLQNNPLYVRSTYSLAQTLRQEAQTPHIIAEFKRASPLRGAIQDWADVEAVVAGYIQAGAAAVSVLTDADFFGAKKDDFQTARHRLHAHKVPILRKDFILTPYQVHQTKAMGADIMLLIAALLTPEESLALCLLAQSLGMEVLLEVHTVEEYEAHQQTPADFWGVNNRNLKDFSTSEQTSHKLLAALPAKALKISESGFENPLAVRKLHAWGYQGFLIGTQFMKQADPAQCAIEFIQASKKRQVKVCGLRDAQNIASVAALSPACLGFILYEKSKRFVGKDFQMPTLPPTLRKVGVLVNAEESSILDWVQRLDLDWLQLHGDETPAFCRDLRRALDQNHLRVGIVKALPLPQHFSENSLQNLHRAEAEFRYCVDMLLFDTQVINVAQASYGGTGKTFDWTFLRRYQGELPFWIAGGLTPDNIPDLLTEIAHQPKAIGIDLNSGFEIAVGEKNAALLQTLIQQL